MKLFTSGPHSHVTTAAENPLLHCQNPLHATKKNQSAGFTVLCIQNFASTDLNKEQLIYTLRYRQRYATVVGSQPQQLRQFPQIDRTSCEQVLSHTTKYSHTLLAILPSQTILLLGLECPLSFWSRLWEVRGASGTICPTSGFHSNGELTALNSACYIVVNFQVALFMVLKSGRCVSMKTSCVYLHCIRKPLHCDCIIIPSFTMSSGKQSINKPCHTKR